MAVTEEMVHSGRLVEVKNKKEGNGLSIPGGTGI